jgi:hypothetical protein
MKPLTWRLRMWQCCLATTIASMERRWRSMKELAVNPVLTPLRTQEIPYEVTRHWTRGSTRLVQHISSPKNSVFWDITPCTFVDSQQTFQRNMSPSSCHLLQAGFLLGLFFGLWRWRRYVPPKRRLNFKRTTRCYIPDDRTLHNHRCENLRSYIDFTRTEITELTNANWHVEHVTSERN